MSGAPLAATPEGIAGAVQSALALGAVLVALIVLRHTRRRFTLAERQARDLQAGLERHLAERTAALRASEERLRGTLDGMIEGCQIVGFDWRYLYLNPSAAAHGRRSVANLVGRTMMEAYPGIETTAVFAAIGRCLADRAASQMENEFTYPDGSKGWFQLSIEPVPEGALILSVDVTARKASEDALRRSEAHHRALLHGLPELVLVLDRGGVCVDEHVPDPALLPVPAEGIRGRRIAEALPAAVARAAEAAIARAVERGASTTFEYELALPGGTRAFEAIAVPMDDGRTTIVARDVTDRQAMEAQLRQAQKMEAVGQLTGGIAHDFNNILTVVGSNAELIAGTLPADSPARQDLDEIVTAVRRGADMIAQLLRFSRRGMLRRDPMDPAAVIRNFAGVLRRLLPATVRLDLGGDDAPGTVLLDPGALEQIVVNLCTNARDAMPRGGTLRIEWQATRLDEGYHATHPWVAPGPYVCIAVSDSGIGMDEATRSRIFEPFFTTKPSGNGTGLGMAMVYGLMKQHQGMVHVYSEPGQGTVVRLYFPRVDGVAPAASPAPARPAPHGRRGSETLLIVEDEAAIRRASRRALEGDGYVALEAADGEEALDVYRRHRDRIALVISDLVMPKLGGRQLAEALRAQGSTVPILFTSGYSSSAAYREGELPPGVNFLHKPWTLHDLLTAVRDLLDAPARAERPYVG